MLVKVYECAAIFIAYVLLILVFFLTAVLCGLYLLSAVSDVTAFSDLASINKSFIVFLLTLGTLQVIALNAILILKTYKMGVMPFYKDGSTDDDPDEIDGRAV